MEELVKENSIKKIPVNKESKYEPESPMYK